MFVLASVAIIQILPLLLAAYALGADSGGAGRDGYRVVGRVLYSLSLISSAIAVLIAVYRDWSYGQPFHRSRLFLFGVGMIPVAVSLAFVFRN